MRRVSLRNLSKRFGNVQALAGLDLEVEAGESLVILGPSGSGKSTLLRIIAGLEHPDEGDVRFDDQSQLHVPAHLRGVAMVFQNFALYPHLTAAQNILLGLRHGLGLSRAEAEARLQEVARTLEIEDILDRKPAQMSGGQRQRVALGRALARRAQIVLFDEPFSGLDAKLRQSLRIEIRELLNAMGATTVFVTHDQLDAMALGDRIAVMREGRIEQVGTPEEVYQRPLTRFVAGFVGTPSMNFFPGRVVGGVLQTEVFGPLRAEGLPDGPVTLGVRPEALRFQVDNGLRLSGEVVAAELSAGEWILYLRARTGEMVAARGGATDRVRPGTAVSLGVRPEDLHVFSEPEGRRLEPVSLSGAH